MPLEAALLAILACPVDKGGLLYFADEAMLYNPRLQRKYLISDGVPRMLAQQAETVSSAEHARLLQLADSGAAIKTLS